MRADDSCMMAILYDPASYAHASYVPDVFRSEGVADATLLNFWLIRQLKLDALSVDWCSGDNTLSLVLSHWYKLPAVVHLLGGYLLRHELTLNGTVLMTDPHLLAFISLPLFHQPILDLPANHRGNTISCGVGFMLRQFPDLPVALRQRLLLHFPTDMAVAPLAVKKNINNTNLLRMALTYAHHYY